MFTAFVFLMRATRGSAKAKATPTAKEESEEESKKEKRGGKGKGKGKAIPTEVNTSIGLPLARVKAIAQLEEDFGRASKASIKSLAVCTELFLRDLVKKSLPLGEVADDVKSSKGASTKLLPQHIAAAIEKDAQYDFLVGTVKTGPVAMAGSKRSRSKRAPGKPQVSKGPSVASGVALPSDVASLMGTSSVVQAIAEDNSAASTHVSSTDNFVEDLDYD